MRRASFALVAALATSAPLATAANNPARQTQPEGAPARLIKSCVARTQYFLDTLVKGDYQAAFENFDHRARAKLDAKAFGAIWQELGSLQSRGVPQNNANQGIAEVTVLLHFDVGDLVAQLSCDENGKFTSFKIVPYQHSSPASAATSTFHEKEIEIGKLPFVLGATLALPDGKGPFPAVVLVSGAGPHDRDETIGPDKPLRDIAHGLAAHGIATLRYDKPSFDHLLAFISRPYTIDDEFTHPAIEAFDALRSTEGIDPRRVFLLGHSQGGEMAPRIARREPLIAGLILVGAPAQSLSGYFQTVRQSSDHLIRLYPQYAAQIRKQAAEAEETRKWLAQANPDHPRALSPDGLPASYWLSLRSYKREVIAVAKSLKQPMLILQGGRDQSVPPRNNFRRWQLAFAHNPRVTLKVYPMLSHLMTPAENPPLPADFKKPEHVDPQVIADIAKWIKAQEPGW